MTTGIGAIATCYRELDKWLRIDGWTRCMKRHGYTVEIYFKGIKGFLSVHMKLVSFLTFFYLLVVWHVFTGSDDVLSFIWVYGSSLFYNPGSDSDFLLYS